MINSQDMKDRIVDLEKQIALMKAYVEPTLEKASTNNEKVRKPPPTKSCICKWCEKPFEKNLYLYNKWLKESKLAENFNENENPFFCSHACAALHQHSVAADEYTPWNYFYTSAKARAKAAATKAAKKGQPVHDFEISIDEIMQLWEEQKGICPYMKIKMAMPVSGAMSKDTAGGPKELAYPHTVSIDRIDSSKGYVLGNIELVCLAVNYAKNAWTREQMIEFFEKKNNQPSFWDGIM